MTRKQRRSIYIGAGIAALGLSAFLILTALKDSIVFFYSPTDVAEKGIGADRHFRLGGLVVAGSFKRVSDLKVEFAVSDGKNTLPVEYSGLLPDLFREGQGVVTEGKLNADKRFIATSVLAKHDEYYMPKDVADSLKKQGVWRHGETPPGQAQQQK